MMYYLCILIIICGVDAKHIKGLYCQDPDTHKLYPVNATWRSETFCGNYTCKLRKLNNTETEYVPIKKINITNKLKEIANDMETSPSKQVFSIAKKSDKHPVYYKDTVNNSNDRYLTEEEIKSIIDILHTIKKSDLDAIIEIYNLAQEIYREMDSATTEKLVKSTIKQMKDEAANKAVADSKKSYFYKPLNKIENLTDMENESTRTTPHRYYPYPLNYFKGPLARDFKAPYYYPMSNFQRSSSYVYNRPYPTTFPPRPCTRPPITPYPPFNYFKMPWQEPLIKPYFKQQRVANPVLLPYPFSYVHHYNYSSYPASYYYNNYPWAQLDLYNKQHTQTQAPVVETEEKKIESKESSEEIKDGVESEGESQPEWKTKPLSEQILDDVRANIVNKSKILLKPLKKSLKLERVGKVIKLDKLTRNKRAVIDVNNKPERYLYEAFIDTTKCEESTDPGFFSVGNMSAPFPECCPKKIKLS